MSVVIRACAGFAWLTMNTANKTLAIESTPNQDNPIMKGYGYSGNAPLLALDVVNPSGLHLCLLHTPEYIHIMDASSCKHDQSRFVSTTSTHTHQ